MSLSTHVLDTARGEPAAGVPVELHNLIGEDWMPVARGRTDVDGRLRDWVPANAPSLGRTWASELDRNCMRGLLRIGVPSRR